MKEDDQWMNGPWLTKIIHKVTRGRHRVVSACIISDCDIDHDLLLDAFRNPSFARSLNALPTEPDAARFAMGFLNRAWHKRKKAYFSKWRRLA
jgi:hypothetical protein